MLVRLVFVGFGSWWEVHWEHDPLTTVTFLGGVRHGRCSRVMTRGLRCVFLTVLTRGRLFVPDTNPLWCPHSLFVDGD